MKTQKLLPVLWDKCAKESLDQIIDYIHQDSPQNARKVKQELIKLCGSLNFYPEKYSKEEFLIDEPENYRSVCKWNFKIIYEVTFDAIIIVDIFSTHQNPSKIRKRVKPSDK